MATLITDVELNLLADAQAARITYVSLHTASPGITGTNEATGGTPAYSRMGVTFTAAGVEGVLGAILQPATDGIAWSDEVTFDVDAGDYTHWGAWNDITAGDYILGNVILPATQSPTSQAEIAHSIGVGPFAGA